VIRAAVIFALCASAVQAADRPAPDYFVDAVMATTTAKQLALACPQISINLVVVSNDAEVVMSQLKTDGFDTGQETLGMVDPTQDIAVMQVAFMDKHKLAEGAATETVCAAAKAEIAAGSRIGTYLLEVEQ
jgi:hypothetical protein